MGHYCQKPDFRSGMPRYALAARMLAVLLSGCASPQGTMISAPQAAEQKIESRAESPAAVEIAPEVRSDFEEGMQNIKAGRYDKGIVLLNKVTEQVKTNAVPYINLAMAYSKVGDLKLAEENLKLALAVEPYNPVASNEYAVLYRKTGRFGEARALYEKILKKYTRFYLARKNLGILCDLYLRDYACALKQYELYSNAFPERKDVKIWIADVRKRSGIQE